MLFLPTKQELFYWTTVSYSFSVEQNRMQPQDASTLHMHDVTAFFFLFKRKNIIYMKYVLS